MFKQSAFSLYAGTLAVFALGAAFSTTLLAADSTKPSFNPVGLSKALAARQAFMATHGNAKALSTRVLGSVRGTGAATGKEQYANPSSAYPASCLVDGLLPNGTTGLPYGGDANAVAFQVTLSAFDSNTDAFDLTETDTFTLFRVPCSGGVSATLLEIDRPVSVNGSFDSYPIFPSIYISQGSNTSSYPRLPQDPDTVFSDTPLTSPLIYSTKYVLEYYDPSASLSSTEADYNQAFTLNVDTLLQDSSGNEIVDSVDVPAYNSAAFGYPSVTNPMEISGYMSTNWSSATEGAEGIVVQVYDNGDKLTRTLAFAWFTYDDLGLPFWLYGQGSLPIGATTITAQTVYFKGGTFAGASGGGTQKPWGSVVFKFPDCGHMNIVYNGDASADNGPKGSASETFVRVADVNGLTCQ